MKRFFLFFICFLVFPFVLAEDNEVAIVGGGDDDTIMMFFGDGEIGSFSDHVTPSVSDTSTGGGGGGTGGLGVQVVVEEEEEEVPEEITLASVLDDILPKFDVNFAVSSKKNFAGVAVDEFVSFTVNGYTRHSISVFDIKNNVVVFEVASEPQLVEVMEYGNVDVDVNGDGEDDINIYVGKIHSDGSVDFTVSRFISGIVEMAKEETKISYSDLFLKFKWIVFFILGAVLFLFGYDRRRKKLRIPGFLIAFALLLLVVFDNWKTLFIITGWKVIPNSTTPLAVGVVVIGLIWLLLWVLLFRKKGRPNGV